MIFNCKKELNLLKCNSVEFTYSSRNKVVKIVHGGNVKSVPNTRARRSQKNGATSCAGNI